MGKKSQIALIVLISLIGLIYGAFLFIVPSVVDLNKFRPEIQKAAREAAGLEFDAGSLELNTYYDLSAGVTAEKVSVGTSKDKPLLNLGSAKVRINLLPLVLQQIDVAELKLDKPEVFLTRLKNGKYDVEALIEKTEKTAPAQPEKQVARSGQKTSAQAESPVFKPVFKGIDVVITNYSVKLADNSASKTRNFTLKGDELTIANFNPEKHAEVIAKGAFLFENDPIINYDLAVKTELPLIGGEKTDNKISKAPAEKLVAAQTAKQPAQPVDPIEGLLKYDFRGDFAADLKLKNNGKIPEIDGTMSFDRLSFKVDGKKLPDSHGKFNFAGKKIDINSKLFITPEAFIGIAGKVKNIAKQDFDINVKTTDILLADVKKFAYTFADVFSADVSALNDITLGGKVKADFNLKKNDYNGFLNIINTRIAHKQVSSPLKNFNSTLKFDKNRIVIEKTGGSIGDIKFNVAGNVSSELKTDVKLDVPAVNLNTVIAIINNSPMFAEIKPQIKDLKNVSGSLKAEATLKGRLDRKINPEAVLSFNRAYVYHAPSRLPVSITRGSINADTEKAIINDIKLLVSNSPITVTGEIRDLTDDIDIDIIARGNVSAADIKKHLPPEAHQAVKPEGLPLRAKITGTVEDIDVTARTNLDNLAAIVRIDQPAGTSNIVNIGARIKPASVHINNTGLYAVSNSARDKSGFYKLDSASGLITVKGDIAGVNTPEPYLQDIKVNISGLNASMTEPKGKVQISGNLLVKGKVSAPKAYGNLAIRNVDIPSVFLKTDRIDIALKDKDITVSTGILNILDSRIAVEAALKNKLVPPYEVNSVKLTSDFINLDSLSQAFARVPQPAQAKRPPASHAAAGHSTAGTSPQQPRDIPVIIHNGMFSAKNLVVSKLLNQNMSFNFTIKPLNLLSIRNFITQTGGGTARGIIDMNLRTTKLNLDCTANGVEINALASTLAQTPDEIFGSMDGRVKLSTIGNTPEAMTNNAVGRASFVVKNGHMPRLANLEHLLSANNLSIKGITGSLLNNTLQFDEAEKTNQFDELKGLVMINRGVLDIQEIKMRGKYLSSFINGTLQMSNNYADLTVLSKLSGQVVKNLGPIKELSVDSLIRKIPGQWGQLLANQRLVSQYPDRDKIPALNNDTLPDDRDFAVKINGALGRPDSVRMFEWLPALTE